MLDVLESLPFLVKTLGVKSPRGVGSVSSALRVGTQGLGWEEGFNKSWEVAPDMFVREA